MPLYEITNKKSKRVSIVSEAEWNQIIDKGWKAKFNYKMVATPVKQPPFVPKEVIDMRGVEKSSKNKSEPENDNSNEKQ